MLVKRGLELKSLNFYLLGHVLERNNARCCQWGTYTSQWLSIRSYLSLSNLKGCSYLGISPSRDSRTQAHRELGKKKMIQRIMHGKILRPRSRSKHMYTSHTLTFHWVELSHMAKSRCYGTWEMCFTVGLERKNIGDGFDD